jgi:hypothetical protein
MKYNTTLVFGTEAADLLLMQGYRIVRVRDNFSRQGKVVFVFEGDIQDALHEVLVQLGHKPASYEPTTVETL